MSDQTSDKIIRLGQQPEISLEGLSDETAQGLKKKHAEGIIDVNTQANKAALEMKILEKKLELLNDAASSATVSGHSLKTSDRHTSESGVTTTEIVTRSSKEVAIIYSLIGLVVVIIVIVAIVAMHR